MFFRLSHMFVNAEYIRARLNALHEGSTPCFFALDYELKEGVFLSADDFAQSPVKFRFGGFSNAPQENFLKAKHTSALKILQTDFAAYKKKFASVMRAIERGDTYLINLTISTPVECPPLEEIFYLSNAPFALLVPEHFVCFSPERFVKIENGKISSCPMKGTRTAESANAHEEILSDFKETCEHNTIVDLLRNDLNAVAKNVRLEKFRYVENFSRRGHEDILQVSSEISGVTSFDKLGDKLFKMLPAGSVTGAPKKKTVEILADVEGEARGFYTGVFGYFDGKSFDSAVCIRFIEKRKGGYFYRSGGGITANSDCRAEFDEALAKIYLSGKPR